MAPASAVAGRMPGFELPARRWPGIVNLASHRLSKFTIERDAARRIGIGAAQPDDRRRHRNSHFDRDAIRPHEGAAGQFGGVEIDTKAGAAGAARLADIHTQTFN